MWENEEHKNLVRNIIIFAVLVVVAAALLITMFAVKKRINAEDELLKAESDSQRQELNNVRKDSLDSVQVAYDADLASLQEYLPGIVCWGDSLTAGSSGSVSYPGTLQKYINTYMCDIYDLASTLDNAEGYSRVDWSQYTVSIPVVNMGSGKETSETILGRSGVEPYVLSADMEIPADTESVAIQFRSEDNKEVKPLTAGNVGFNPVTIGGVEGTITLETNTQSWGQSYYFTRSTAGDPVTVEKGTQVIPACTDAYKDYIHIVWLGTYDGVDDPAKLVSDTKELLSRQAKNPDRYLVLGPCTVRGSWTSANVTTMEAIDSAMMQAFGSHYVNIRKYLLADGMTDAKFSVTKEDKVVIQQSMVPISFRSNSVTGADLNGSAYRLIGKLVYDRMSSLGYFDEVRQELGLDKTTQDILKNNPKYFENILNAM